MGAVANEIDGRWTASSQYDPTAFQACKTVRCTPILHYMYNVYIGDDDRYTTTM